MRKLCKNALRVFREIKERACVHCFWLAKPLGLVLVSLWICFGLWCAICLIWDWLHGINCSWASSDLQNKLHIEHQLTQKKSRRKTRCTVTMKFNLHSGLNVVRSHSCSSTYKYLLLADCIFSITFVILVKLCPEQLTFEWCLLTNHYAKLTRACFLADYLLAVLYFVT